MMSLTHGIIFPHYIIFHAQAFLDIGRSLLFVAVDIIDTNGNAQEVFQINCFMLLKIQM